MIRGLHRVCLLVVLVGLGSVGVIGTAEAQQRDRALSQVIDLNQQLIARVQTGNADGDAIWAGVQALTEAMRRFILAETEARADDKVAPPAITALRPGETLKETTDDPGTVSRSLETVPTAWFNRQARSAQDALDTVRRAVEEEAPRETLVLRLTGVLNALERMRHPPEAG